MYSVGGSTPDVWPTNRLPKCTLPGTTTFAKLKFEPQILVTIDEAVTKEYPFASVTGSPTVLATRLIHLRGR